MGFLSNAVDYFFRGGPCMWPLLLCSFMAIVIGFERICYYRQAFSEDSFIVPFREAMHRFDIDEAQELARRAKGDAAEMARDMLAVEDEELGKRYEAIVYGKTDRYVDQWEAHLNYLEVIIGLSPMLGLLGTITGMISSFNALNERVNNPLAVTAGIGEALITTVFGLIISILGMLILAYLNSRLKTGVLRINELADVLVNIYNIRHKVD